MTVHSAKGLEFPYVFLCAMNEGVFPSRKTRTLPGMEEERGLPLWP
jgi:DNA helicase-2/ATP-dependent DNA helicase PcrA